MTGFKLVCGRCGSTEVLEKSAEDKKRNPKGIDVYEEGVQRKCLDCSNTDFVIFKTYRMEKNE